MPELVTNADGIVLINFGKHKGELITAVPVNYLTWVAREVESHSDAAKVELERRGTPIPPMNLTAHSIDRASQRVLGIWEKTRENDNEGIYTWLSRVASEAYDLRPNEDADECEYKGIRFFFGVDGAYPVLKSVVKMMRPKHSVEKPEHNGKD
jgi:hypothetical protein